MVQVRMRRSMGKQRQPRLSPFMLTLMQYTDAIHREIREAEQAEPLGLILYNVEGRFLQW